MKRGRSAHHRIERFLPGPQARGTGILDALLVHPREVFRPAIVAAAGAIVLMHNHPSGDPQPSESDIKVTRELIRSGQLLKIEVLDHVILGAGEEFIGALPWELWGGSIPENLAIRTQ